MTCQNCGATRQENYCPACGEKKFHPKSLHIKHYAEETLEGLFHFDNKFFRSLKTLVVRPGQLTLDFVQGRRVRHMRPFALFVIVNLVAFFALLTNPFSIPLKNYVTYTPFTNFNTVERVNAKVAAEGISYGEYERRFNASAHGASKTLLIVFIPVYALLFGLLLINKKRTAVEHLLFATHYMAFVLVAFLLTMYLVMLPLELIFGSSNAIEYDFITVLYFSFVFCAYLFFAIKRFYKTKMWQTLLTAAFVGLNFFTLLVFYRMLLFDLILRFGR